MLETGYSQLGDKERWLINCKKSVIKMINSDLNILFSMEFHCNFNGA